MLCKFSPNMLTMLISGWGVLGTVLSGHFCDKKNPQTHIQNNKIQIHSERMI